MSTVARDQLERVRELMVTLREATEELSTLYGPLWHEREALRHAVPDPAGIGSVLALIEALERGDKLAYTGNLVVTDPDTEATVQMVLDADDFAALKALAAYGVAENENEAST